MLLAMNIPLVAIFVRVLLIPPRYLMPAVAMISFVGIYGISGSTFDLTVMVGFGVLGYVLRKLDVPLVPIILGVLLGNEMEKNLRRALTISDGDLSILWGSWLAIGLWTIAIVGFFAPMIVGRYFRLKVDRTEDAVEANTD
jgi:putative tricarboxylic transport membrane protein